MHTYGRLICFLCGVCVCVCVCVVQIDSHVVENQFQSNTGQVLRYPRMICALSVSLCLCMRVCPIEVCTLCMCVCVCGCMSTVCVSVVVCPNDSSA